MRSKVLKFQLVMREIPENLRIKKNKKNLRRTVVCGVVAVVSSSILKFLRFSCILNFFRSSSILKFMMSSSIFEIFEVVFHFEIFEVVFHFEIKGLDLRSLSFNFGQD